MREWLVYGMIYLGSIMFFRWEKYRLVSQYKSFLAFHFCTMIARLSKNPKTIILGLVSG